MSLFPLRWRTAPYRRLVGVLSLLALLLATVLLVREALLGQLLAWLLDYNGLGPARIAVHRLDTRHAVFQLQQSKYGRIERIEFDYAFATLVHGRLQDLRVRGARLTFTRAKSSQGSTPVMTDGRGIPLRLPIDHIGIEDCTFTMAEGADTTALSVAGEITGVRDMVATLALAVQSASGGARARLHARIGANGESDGTLSLQHGALDTAALAAHGLTGSLHWQAHGAELERLRATLDAQQLRGASRLELGAATLRASYDASGAGFDASLHSSPLNVAVQVRRGAPGTEFAYDLHATAVGDFVATLGGARANRDSRLTLDLTGSTPAIPAARALSALGSDDWWREARMQAHLGVHLRDLQVPTGLHVAEVTSALAASLAQGVLTLDAPQATVITGLSSSAPPAATDVAPSASSNVTLAALGAAPLLVVRPRGTTSLATSGTLALATQATLSTADTVQLRAELDVRGAYRVLAAALEFRFDNSVLRLPSQGLALHDAAGFYAQAANQSHLELAHAQLDSLAEPPWFTPLDVQLEASRGARHIDFGGKLTGADEQFVLAFTGQHDPVSHAGKANIALKPFALAPAGALAALSPAAAATISARDGTIRAEGALPWGNAVPAGDFTVTLDDIAVGAGALMLDGLDGAITLASLQPLRTPPAQRLQARVILPKLAPVPVDLRLRLEPGRLVLEQAQARMFDGTFRVSDARYELEGQRGAFDLTLEDIDLEAALTVLGLEQCSGSGRIGGHLPLHYEAGKLTISNGHLAATTPGQLQLKAGSLGKQLQSYGENVDLVLRALADFHYQTLSIDVEKSALGSGTAVFHLTGNNPAVMNGRGFVFNINVEANFDRLSALLLELSSAANGALGWGTRELLKQ